MKLEVPFGEGRIIGVPAVHYRSEFACAVREVFVGPDRPKAVAVELGPEAVVALASWIRELTEDPRWAGTLPCMLGLLHRNRRIHPDYKQAAIQLQEIHGLPLHKISPAVLRQELRYGAFSLLCLSATDSIIEAVRCAVEYNIPVYGVDLGDFASRDRGPVVIEDPKSAQRNLAMYVDRNAGYGKLCRDTTVDGRREYAMAGRLKTLVYKYESVLFTGGLAHWSELKRLLQDPNLPESPERMPVDGGDAWIRVVVDPAIAVRHMDVFPEVTPQYERVRSILARRPGARSTIGQKLRANIGSAFQRAATDVEGRPCGVARGQLRGFLSYLNSLCLVSNKVVPDLAIVLRAAEAFVSRDFAQRLGRLLVDSAGVNWLKPEDMPALPYLRAVPFTSGEYDLGKDCHKTELVSRRGRRSICFVDAAGDGLENESIQLESFFPGKGNHEQDESRQTYRSRYNWIWPPCESLLYGTAYQAAETALTNASTASEPFAGSLHAGIDNKATLRSAARAENRVYVKVPARGRPLSIREALVEPFVFIFDTLRAARSTELRWQTCQGIVEPNHLRPESLELYQTIRETKGDVFVVSAHVAEERTLPPKFPSSDVASMHILWGTIAFGNPCLNAFQLARWLEEERFACCPVVRTGGQLMDALVRTYASLHGVSLDLTNWPETLVRLAVHYARRRVVVIAPDHLAVTPRTRMEARRRQVSIDIFPLSFFAAERIAAIRTRYGVYPKDDDATEWSDEVIRLLGPADAHFELLPPWMRKQAIPNN